MGKYIEMKNNNGYQYVSRINNQRAAVIIPYLFDETQGLKFYQLIISKRPTFNEHIIQFPAGLIDEGETIQQAAIRELKEQTGWSGLVKDVYLESPSSAGLSNQLLHVVIIQLKEKYSTLDLDMGQDITLMPLMTVKEINEYIKKNKNLLVSSRVLTFLIGNTI